MYRRKFLKTSGLLSLAPIVPTFISRLGAETRPETDQTILVVIELDGGNDGINTVVPFKDESYAKVRTKLKLDSNKLHLISDEMGLHPSMQRSKEQFDAGELVIINGVGYPNPNRSHFESRDIWYRGLTDSRRANGEGWLGNALDISRDPNEGAMDGYFVGRGAISSALTSRRAQIAALSRFSDLQLDASITTAEPTTSQNETLRFVQRQVTGAYATSRQIESVANAKSSGGFPDSKLGQQLRMISQLIKSDSAARVYYTTQAGYDTHASQSFTHENLLRDLSRAMKAFVDDLKQNGLDDRVTVFAFSEFGRRVQENSSLGTDHGSAGPVFVSGTQVQAGLIGETTSLTDLEDGDIKMQFDFRRVYATLLDQWLGISSETVLQEKFEHLDLFV